MNRWWILALLIAAGTVVSEILAGPHGYFHWHFIPAFDLAFGFVGCVAIVLVSKALGKGLLQRPEGYTPEAGGPAAWEEDAP